MLSTRGCTVEAAREALLASRHETTVYSTVCDLGTREVHLWVGRDFKSGIEFDLAEELAKGPRKFDLVEFFERRLLVAEGGR